MAKILVIEDQDEMRMMILRLLKYEGFESVGSEDGMSGVQLAKQHLPDLIVCDIVMPQLSGYGVLTQLRKDPVTATIPFIFLTGQQSRQNMRQGMALGADDYLTKPFDPEELITAIHTQLQKRATISALASKQLDDLRLQLSYVLPHEFRTPLNVIMGFAQLLRRFGPDTLPRPGEIVEMADGIYENTVRLQRMIENYLLYTNLMFLDYSVDARARWLRDTPVGGTKELIMFRATQRAEVFRRADDLQFSLVDATLHVSEKALHKIVEELVDNALKFSKAGIPVRITSALHNDHYLLRVADQGRGMTPEEIAAVGAFIQFERKRYEQQGLGLGLIIARMLARLYEGDLTIESVPTQGTTVIVSLKIGYDTNPGII